MWKVVAAKKSLVAKKSFSTTTPVKTAPATVLDHDADDDTEIYFCGPSNSMLLCSFR